MAAATCIASFLQSVKLASKGKDEQNAWLLATQFLFGGLVILGRLCARKGTALLVKRTRE